MKNTLFTLLVILGTILRSTGFAQSDSSIIDQSDFIIEHLNKNNIPTGFLYDRLVPFAQLYMHNGQNDSAITSPLHFHQAYYEWYQSAFNKGTYTTPQALADNIIDNYSNATHPVALLLARFAAIKPNAVEDSLLKIHSGQLYEVPGAASPYEEKYAFVACPLTTGEHVDIGLHRFILSEDFILGNDYKAISSVSISLVGSGEAAQVRYVEGILPAYYDTVPAFEFSLDTTGLYTFKIEVMFTDSTTAYSQAAFGVVEGSGYGTDTKGRLNPEICNDCIVIQGRDGGDQINITGSPYAGMANYGEPSTPIGGTAYIFYATNNNNYNYNTRRIRKPILFIDGYDPTNTRDAPRIYSKYINENIFVNGVSVDLATYLRSQGYDLIILDFDNGGDYIEKNAMVVVELLKKLYNDHKNWLQEEFVVIGPSMGALIGQFALAYMETNNIPHHARTYISFDGPHQGANVAYGVQMLIEYALQSNILNAVTNQSLTGLKHQLYNNPAARQMLVHHVSSGSNLPVADWRRNVFLNNLASVGNYAQELRNVAVINGNKTAALNPNVSPTTNLVWLRHYLYIPMQIIYNPARFWIPPIITPPVTQHINWKVFGSSNAGTQKVAEFFTIWPLANIIGGVPLGTTNKYSSCHPSSFSYDQCQGSNFGNGSLIDGGKKTLKDYIGWLPFSKIELDNLTQFTFIPTVSAADYIQNNSLNIAANLTNVTLSKCAGTTPFDKVYADVIRTDHVAVNEFIGNAFVNEIMDIDANLKITGNTSFFTINNRVMGSLPRNFTASGGSGSYTWNYTGNWSTSQSSTNNNTFSINQLYDFNGGTIEVNDGCATVSKQIKVSTFYADGSSQAGNTASTVKLYPNPTKSVISLEITSDEFDPLQPINFTVVNMLGSVRMQNTYPTFKQLNNIDVSALNPGVYFVTLQQNSFYHIVRFIKYN